MKRERDSDDGDSGRRHRFKYRRRTLEALKARAEQKGGSFDRTFKSGLKSWTPKEGESTIRVLPPTWTEPKPDHYGFDVWMHNSVGPDNQTYLCLQKMKGDDCPICEGYAELQEEANEKERKGEKDEAKKLNEAAYQLKAKKKVCMWIVVRGLEQEGPMLYLMPWTLDKNLTDRMIDKRSGDWLAVDDPEEGYDLTFKRDGTRQNTKYTGETVARNPSPLNERRPKRAEEWLDFVQENPVPDTLLYYDYDYISKAFNGSGKDDDEEDSDDERPSRKGHKDRDDDGPRRKSRRNEDEEEDDDEEERPSRKSKREEPDEDEDERPASKSKRDIDDEDEEIDEDDDSEDEPKATRGGTPSTKGKKRVALEDEDDEEDRPRKGKHARRDDPDEDEEDSDDEDEPRPAKGKGKASRDEDEDEDERPRKAKASKREEKPRRRSRDDEESGADGDDDIPF